jgi:hypothetical protein
VEVPEFNAGIFSCEVPVGFGVILVADVLPSRDFLDEDFPVEALRGQDTKFRFGQVKPPGVFRGVMSFEALSQAAGKPERPHRATSGCQQGKAQREIFEPSRTTPGAEFHGRREKRGTPHLVAVY